MHASSEEAWIRRLLDVGRELVTELDFRVVLDRERQRPARLSVFGGFARVFAFEDR